MKICAINNVPISKYRSIKLSQEKQTDSNIPTNSNVGFKGVKGSIFGGLVGMMVAGPLGAVVGAILGSAPPDEPPGGGGGGSCSSSDKVKD